MKICHPYPILWLASKNAGTIVLSVINNLFINFAISIIDPIVQIYFFSFFIIRYIIRLASHKIVNKEKMVTFVAINCERNLYKSLIAFYLGLRTFCRRIRMY